MPPPSNMDFEIEFDPTQLRTMSTKNIRVERAPFRPRQPRPWAPATSRQSFDWGAQSTDWAPPAADTTPSRGSENCALMDWRNTPPAGVGGGACVRR